MQMNEPHLMHPESSTTIGTMGLPASRNSLTATLVLVVCVLAWGFISYWSVSLVAYGIESAKLFPPGFGSAEIWAFALALQAVVSVFGLIVPFFWRSWKFVLFLPLLIGVYLAITGFEGFHGVLAQHKRSMAPAMLERSQAEIDSLARRISTASTQLKQAYDNKKAAYASLADDAAKGRDETGIAKCEEICRQYRRRYAEATARFSHLALDAAPPPASQPAGSDLRAQLNDAAERSQKLSGARKDLVGFYKELDGGEPPAVLVAEIDAIATAVTSKSAQYSDLNSLTTFTLAMQQSNQAFADILGGRLPEMESRLPMVYGLLPGLVILALSIMIRACLAELGPGYYGIGHTAFDWAHQSILSRILPRLDALSVRNFIYRIRIRARNAMS